MSVADGEFAALVGPSGCGKTTLLNLIAGLEDVDEGCIRRRRRNALGRGSTGERFGYMPQQDLLFPWRTVLENVSLGLEVHGRRRNERRVSRAAELCPAIRTRRIRSIAARTSSRAA